jgi:hypothetical protein
MFARYQILIVAATILSTSAQSTPIVDLGYAQYQGAVSAANISHFLGIRYAAAPLGLLDDLPGFTAIEYSNR